MKQLFTLLFACNLSLAFSQVYTSSCVATPQMEILYKNDAYKYASARLIAINSPYKDSVVIPIIFRDSIAKVFYAIQNMANSSVKDTILHIFGFTNFSTNYYSYVSDSLHFHATLNPPAPGNLSVKSMDMYASTSVPWANNWAMGNYNNTSNAEVNQLVNQYQLSVTQGFGFPNAYFFKVKSAAAINPKGLAFRFNAILNSTTACTPGYFVGDGNAVGLSYENDGIRIRYRHACGDCPAGCTYGRIWTFKVFFNECSVQYLGAEDFGSPNPPNYNVYTCIGPVLPVTFGTLTGYLQSGKAALNWKVLTQVNVKEYVIERSDNGQQFYPAVTVAAKTTTEYSWKEFTPLNGTAWYRIKAVDKDGKSKYSSIVKISSATKGNAFTLYPNPVTNRTFTVQFATPAVGQMRANLYSIDGKKVWTTTVNLAPSTTSRTITLPSNLQPGVYAFVVESNSSSYRQTLVVAD